jgi:hypothetical protein
MRIGQGPSQGPLVSLLLSLAQVPQRPKAPLSRLAANPGSLVCNAYYHLTFTLYAVRFTQFAHYPSLQAAHPALNALPACAEEMAAPDQLRVGTPHPPLNFIDH